MANPLQQNFPDKVNSPCPSSAVRGIRTANSEPVLGLKFVGGEAFKPTAISGSASATATFVEMMTRLVQKTCAGKFEILRKELAEESVASSSVRWRREQWQPYPVYIERLEIAPAGTELPHSGAHATIPAPGVLKIPAEVLNPESPLHFAKNEAAWKSLVEGWATDAESGASGPGAGGFAYNLLEIPAAALTSGEVDLRPAALHALAADGSGCDRSDPDAQAAIANAFWQTFWATGALRAERGAVFPVAFLPIDRTHAAEFSPPFRERYVSLRRRLFGRTAILAHLNEALTRALALLFDTRRLRFCVAPSFDAQSAGLSAADVTLAISELNRTAFIDAYIGENCTKFARWREREAAIAAGRPSDHSATEQDSVHPSPDAAAADLVRIHRVIPFAGCAYLREVVKERPRLEQRGKLRSLSASDEIIAATNSTFFLNFPEEYATLHSAMNDPVSLLVEDGRTLQIKTLRRAAFVLTAEGRAVITTRAGIKLNAEPLIFEGESQAASFAERAHQPFRANKFPPVFFGSVVVGDSIVETFEEMETEVPANGWVIGDSEAFGGEIQPERAAEVQVRLAGENSDARIRHAFAVGPLLVENGRAVPFGESKEDFAPIRMEHAPSVKKSRDLARTELPPELLDCEQRGMPPMRFPHDWDLTRAPRTGIGVRANGDVLLVVVDGRADLAHSVGASLAELAQLMINLGCVTAMNCDGGGSSVMFVNDPRAAAHKLRDELADGVVNLPSDRGGVERLLPVPLLVCRKSPTTPPNATPQPPA